MNKRIKKRIAISIIAGSILVIASLVFYLSHIIIGARVFSVIFITGICIFGNGCKDANKYRKYPSALQEEEIERRDERNVQVWNKAGYISFIFTALALLLLSAVLDDLGYELPSNLTFWLAILSFVVCFASRWYFNKKM